MKEKIIKHYETIIKETEEKMKKAKDQELKELRKTLDSLNDQLKKIKDTFRVIEIINKEAYFENGALTLYIDDVYYDEDRELIDSEFDLGLKIDFDELDDEIDPMDAYKSEKEREYD